MATDYEIQSNLERLTGLQTVVVEEPEEGLSPEMAVALGQGMAQHYMAKNGPTQPRRFSPKMEMTRAQLEEQKMNEAQGYPSNLDEAARVRALEQQVRQINQGLGLILEKLSGGTPGPAQPTYPPPYYPPSPTQSSQVLSPNVQPAQNPAPTSPILPHVRPVIDKTIRGIARQAAQAVQTALQAPSPTVSAASTSPGKKVVRLSNGKTVVVSPTQPSPPTTKSPMSLGPTLDKLELVDPREEMFNEDDPALWTETPAATPEPQNDPAAERLAFVIQEVTTFLYSNKRDPLTYFRKRGLQQVHRQAGFSAWPKQLQERFLTHFKTILNDPVFVKGQVATVLSFTDGHAIGIEHIAGILTLAAGFMAYSLAGAELNA